VEFTSIALQKTGLTASAYELALAETLMAGTYYWRVRAIDGAGNAGLWSESWSFTVSIAPPPSAILLMTAIALLVIAIIAAIALYLIKRKKRKKEKVITSGPRQVAFKQTRR
jgi:ABC-type antimicrobial peptide transport system permease subunit